VEYVTLTEAQQQAPFTVLMLLLAESSHGLRRVRLPKLRRHAEVSPAVMLLPVCSNSSTAGSLLHCRGERGVCGSPSGPRPGRESVQRLPVSAVLLRQSVLNRDSFGSDSDRQGFASRLNELDDVIGVGNHRDVVGWDFDGSCAHALGELALGVGRDRLVAVGDQKPGRVTAPQFPETSLADDVARLRHVLSLQSGPTVVAGHSYGGQIITALGTDPRQVRRPRCRPDQRRSQPSACSRSMTALQQEPSAPAPWTRTIFGRGLISGVPYWAGRGENLSAAVLLKPRGRCE
jgi:hypothetical protein